MSTIVTDYSYTPYLEQSDEEIRRILEAEILEQWFEADSDELPPDVEQVEAESVAGEPWSPASKAQQLALECEADIILFGGQAGTYKSETLLVNFSVEVDNPNYNAIIFRQSFPELRDLIKKSIKLYKPLGGKFTKGSPLKWEFPSGATIWLGYMGHDDDVFAHQGAEYSAIGFDEAGHQTESRIRYMLTRLRSTDPTLRLRMFLTANPGGPGHATLMHMFLKGVCPHCDPKNAVVPGKLYYDATWKSDGQPLSVTLANGKKMPRSVAFIPGRLQTGDKDYLGDAYAANLMMQAAATAAILLSGCWKAWEGQFFDCFDERRGADEHGRRLEGGPDLRMVLPLGDVPVEWWYPHIVSGDYGFSGSSASAHLGVQLPPSDGFPDGRKVVLDEIVLQGVTAKDFAWALLKRWVLEEDAQFDQDDPRRWYLPEKTRNIVQWVVSPDAFRKDGSVNDQDVPFSRLEQMNEVLGRYGFAFMRANDDRKSGWMLLYQLLRDGGLQICRHCKQTIEMFQTRLRDPKKMDDIWKVKGDPLDDIADDLRYMCMTWGMAAQKPKEIVIAEAVQGLDPTNAMMTIRKIESDYSGRGGSVEFAPKMRRGSGRMPSYR